MLMLTRWKVITVLLEQMVFMYPIRDTNLSKNGKRVLQYNVQFVFIYMCFSKSQTHSLLQSHADPGWTHFLYCNNLNAFLSEATERRTAALDRQTSPSQLPTALLTLEGMTSYKRIEEAFHCKLKGPVVVDKKTLVELQNFQTVCLLRPIKWLNQLSFALCLQQCFTAQFASGPFALLA